MIPPLQLPIKSFLETHWQRKPLLVRQALPGLPALISRDQLFSLAGQEDYDARLITQRGENWMAEAGPFTTKKLNRLGDAGWALLVHDVNHFSDEITELLLRFNFVSYARLDDVMVNYSPAGGSVGPHFDSYDVFLIQVGGRKRWQISTQSDRVLLPDSDVKILADFRAEQTWTLDPGDLLYLPPGVNHYGVALEPGFTYSIGFRAPAPTELAHGFLDFLRDRVELPGTFSDAGRTRQKNPAALDMRMAQWARSTLGGLRWNNQTVRTFLGEYLTEPKMHVIFEPLHEPIDAAALSRMVRYDGLRLDRRSRLMFHGNTLFMNGESHRLPRISTAMVELANSRRSPPGEFFLDPEHALLLDWFNQGWVHSR